MLSIDVLIFFQLLFQLKVFHLQVEEAVFQFLALVFHFLDHFLHTALSLLFRIVHFILKLLPYLDASEIREHQTETTEAVRLIQYKGPLPVGGFYDIEESVSLARKGGTLTMAQLLKVLYNMKTAERVRSFLKGDVPELPVMFAIAMESLPLAIKRSSLVSST